MAEQPESQEPIQNSPDSITNESQAALSSSGSLLSPEFMARLESLGVVSQKLLSGQLRGERRSRKRGESLEFADYRNYVQGDDLRRIDWNLYGRLERLFLKLFQAEEDLSFYIFLDGSRSMDFGAPNKFDYARRVAAALAYIGMVNLDRVSLSIHSGEQEHFLSDLRGKNQAFRLFKFLENIKPSGSLDLHEAVKRFLLRRRRPGVMVLISDFFIPEGYEDPLKLCKSRRMDTFALHLAAPEEIEPQPTGDVKLIDSETGDEVDITASPRLVEMYKKTMRGYCSELREFCAQRDITYLFSGTNVPFEGLVVNYLRRARLLR